MPVAMNDTGRILYICDAETVPGVPYWNAIMVLSYHTDQVHQADGLAFFLDEDQRVLGIDMPTPVVSGVPEEAVLHTLRTMIPEDEITWMLGVLVEADRQIKEMSSS
ncbi:MAG: hypothetical protein HN750_17375 [Gemmatimonadales bacterium]|jgi:hypothetical protein|nr:hypothetical protein [Gemmatimonadales bacterium]